MEIDTALQIGRDNERAKSLLLNHCLNADFKVRVSPLGHQVNLPIGMVEIGCKFAPYFGESQMQGMDLAVRFYERSCPGCPHQRPTGLVPTIANEAAAQQELRQEEALRSSQALQDRRSEWSLRQAARDQVVAGQPYLAQDLKQRIDLLDPDPTAEPIAEPEAQTARQKVIETARAAPQLFSAALIETIEGLAEARDGMAHEVLLALATSGYFPKDRAAQRAVRTLTTMALPEAGDIVVALASELSPDEIAEACRGIIFLTAEPDHFFRPGFARSEPLLAVAAVAWPIVRDTVIEMLCEDGEDSREVAAHAARHLVTDMIGRLDELGRPLMGAIWKKDRGYGGDPAPAGAVIRALASAWRLDSTAVMQIVEEGASALDDDSREQLVGIVRLVVRGGNRTPNAQTAIDAAIAFLIRRLDGSWGTDASTAASDDLPWIARDYPDLVSSHLGSLYNRLLDASRSIPPRSQLLYGPPSPIERMEQEIARSGRLKVRRDVAEAIGAVAKAGFLDALNRAFTIFRGTTGDSKDDVTARAVLVDVLAKSVTTESVASIIPHLYSALLKDEALVRASAIELWASCARVVTVLPADLEALLPVLLSDPYKIVHSSIVSTLPKLKLSEKARRESIMQVFAIAESYLDEGGWVLREALSALLWSAEVHDAETIARAAMYVIRKSSSLSAVDREQVLLESRLVSYRATPEWAMVALDVISAQGRPRSGAGEDRLTAALLADPQGMAEVPLAIFERIALRDIPDEFARATEVVELLQAGGRWRDAAILGNALVNQIEDTVEKSGLRMAAIAFAAVADAEATAFDGAPPASLAIPEERGFQRRFWIHAKLRHRAREAITQMANGDPAGAAEVADEITRVMAVDVGDNPVVALYVKVLAVAVGLLRYDAAIRSADPQAERFLLASKRNARALSGTVRTIGLQDDSIGRFLARAADVGDADLDEVLRLAAMIPISLSLTDRAGAGHRYAKRTDSAPSRTLASPVVVCVPLLNGGPVVNTIVLRPEMTHDLALELRMDTWPEFADRCEIDLLSTITPDVIDVPRLELHRADGQADPYGLLFSTRGHINVHTARPAGSDPIDLPIHVRFVSTDGRTDTAVVAGCERLRVIPYDPSQHALTDLPQIDERLLRMYDELLQDETLDDADVKAFCRFFTACVNAARRLMFEKEFRAGTRVTERQFHDALEELLRQDPTLEGRLSRGDKLAGGFDDLRHDTIVAELKVVKRAQKQVEGEARYVAQPIQYAVDTGSRLSITIVLDHSPKNAPPRVLENDFHWEYPVQHDDATTRYPSRVAVLTIYTNWPVPSAWSRRPNQVRSREQLEPSLRD